MDPTLDSYSILNPGVSTLLDPSQAASATAVAAATGTSSSIPSSTPSLLDTITNTFGSAVNTLESVFTSTTQAALNQAQTNSTLAAQQAAGVNTTATKNSSLMLWVLGGLAVILLVRK